MSQPLTNCTCYVKDLDPRLAHALRRSAHAEACPLYEAPADPETGREDARLREMGQRGTLEEHWRDSWGPLV